MFVHRIYSVWDEKINIRCVKYKAKQADSINFSPGEVEELLELKYVMKSAKKIAGEGLNLECFKLILQSLHLPVMNGKS